MVECEECEGTGLIYDLCQACNGSGEGAYDGALCTKCRGSGEDVYPCECCDGKGKYEIEEEDEDV